MPLYRVEVTNIVTKYKIVEATSERTAVDQISLYDCCYGEGFESLPDSLTIKVTREEEEGVK